jgi:hypothetical protein
VTARAHHIFGWAILALGVALGAYALRGTWAVDLTALYFAGHFFREGLTELVYLPGHEVFVTDPPAAYVALGEAEGWRDGVVTPYLYPPLWAALLAPLTAVVTAHQFFWGAQVLNLAALAGSIWLSFHMVSRRTKLRFDGWVALSLLLAAGTGLGLFGLWLGQPQILVGFVILLAFYLLMRGQDIGAGAALALAAAIKLSPALLVIVFVMEARWRAVAAFAAVGAGFGLVSIGLAGWPLHAELLEKLAAIDARVLVARTSTGLEMVFYQIGRVLNGTAVWQIATIEMPPEPSGIGWPVRALLLTGLALVFLLTRGLDQRRRIWARLIGSFLVTLLASPLPWNHYLILPLLMLPGLVAFWPVRRVVRLALVTWVPLSLPAFLLMAPQDALHYPMAALNVLAALWMLALVLTAAATAPRGGTRA